MKIQRKDLFHGAALTQIAEHDSFKALNKADAKYGHYLVNTDKRLMTKLSKGEDAPWQFTFNEDDLLTLQADIASGFTTFLVLVCGEKTICLLNQEEMVKLIDLEAERQQWIRVDIPKASMAVKGSAGSLARKIPHNSFPDRIFT